MECQSLSFDNRHYGLDIFKIVSMFLIVLLHSLSYGALRGVAPFSKYYEVGFFIEALAYCCVNCFALASGYIGVETKFKYRRIIPLWLQVVFYTVIMTLLFVYIKPDLLTNKALIGEHPFLKAFTPVSHETYWYFTAYFALFFFIPFINRGMRDISARQAYAFIGAVIVVYIAIPYFAKKDLFVRGVGYNSTWIILMYGAGAALRKCKIEKVIKNKYWFLVLYVVFAAMAWGGKFITEYLSQKNGNFKNDNVFLQYTSIFIVLSAISLLLFFANIKIRNNIAKRVINNIAPAAFGVYIIHTNPYAFQLPFWGNLTRLCSKSLPVMVSGVLINAIIVFVVCIVIDWLRIQFFKLLCVRKIVDAAADFLNRKINILCKRFS